MRLRRRLESVAAGPASVAGLVIGVCVAVVALFGFDGVWGLVQCGLLLAAAAILGLTGRAMLAPVLESVELIADKESGEKGAKMPSPEPREIGLELEPAPFSITQEIPGLLEMVVLPGGQFWMGSADEDIEAYDTERPRHRVTLSSFWMARTPVTRRLYQKIMRKGRSEWEQEVDDMLPANYLDWFDAVRFCNALSRYRGYAPCYREGEKGWEQDRSADGFRLPTEAEWEYAARAGTQTRWSFGDDPAELGRYAWFVENAGNQLHPVGQKESNDWGLYDMAGNVWEWCWDLYGRYTVDSTINPEGPLKGDTGVLRGGAFWDVPWVLRSADRSDVVPEGRDVDVGFRCVRVPRRQP